MQQELGGFSQDQGRQLGEELRPVGEQGQRQGLQVILMTVLVLVGVHAAQHADGPVLQAVPPIVVALVLVCLRGVPQIDLRSLPLRSLRQGLGSFRHARGNGSGPVRPRQRSATPGSRQTSDACPVAPRSSRPAHPRITEDACLSCASRGGSGRSGRRRGDVGVPDPPDPARGRSGGSGAAEGDGESTPANAPGHGRSGRSRCRRCTSRSPPSAAIQA